MQMKLKLSVAAALAAIAGVVIFGHTKKRGGDNA